MKYKRKKDRDFWQLARSYLHDYIPVTRNLSDKSVEAYKQSLKTYLKFLDEEKSLAEKQVTFESFTRDNLKDFIGWLKKNRYSPKTINLKLTAIRSFLKYCSEEDFELRGIYSEVCTVKKQKEEKHPIEYLQPKATAAILAAYDSRTAKHRRDRMMLIMLYDTGARVRELADLNLSSLHIETENPFVTLIGKGKKSRNVPLMKKTVSHLDEYLREFHSKRNENPLFYSMFGGQPYRRSTDSISLVLKTASDKARESCNEVPSNVHCHMEIKAIETWINNYPRRILKYKTAIEVYEGI